MDLSVVFHRNGALDMKRGFDVGAGPGFGVEEVLRELQDLADEGDVDDGLVRRASWVADWEPILLGEDERPGWKRSGDEVIVAACERAELERILAAMDALRPAVAQIGASKTWDGLSAFLRACHKSGGSIALWCDLAG